MTEPTIKTCSCEAYKKELENYSRRISDSLLLQDLAQNECRKALQEIAAKDERIRVLEDAAREVADCLRLDKGEVVTIHDSCADLLESALSGSEARIEKGGSK